MPSRKRRRHDAARSLRPAPRQQCTESRVGAIRVPLHVRGEVDQMDVPGVVCPIEPGKDRRASRAARACARLRRRLSCPDRRQRGSIVGNQVTLHLIGGLGLIVTVNAHVERTAQLGPSGRHRALPKTEVLTQPYSVTAPAIALSRQRFSTRTSSVLMGVRISVARGSISLSLYRTTASGLRPQGFSRVRRALSMRVCDAGPNRPCGPARVPERWMLRSGCK